MRIRLQVEQYISNITEEHVYKTEQYISNITDDLQNWTVYQ